MTANLLTTPEKEFEPSRLLRLPEELILLIFSCILQQDKPLQYLDLCDKHPHTDLRPDPIIIPTMRKYRALIQAKPLDGFDHPLDAQLFCIWNQKVYDLAVQALMESNVVRLNGFSHDVIDLSLQCHAFLRPFVRRVVIDLYYHRQGYEIMHLLDQAASCPGIASVEFEVSKLTHADSGSNRKGGFCRPSRWGANSKTKYYPMPPPDVLTLHFGFQRILQEFSMDGHMKTLFLNFKYQYCNAAKHQEAVRCVVAWLRLWFSQNDARNVAARLRVVALFNGEMMENDVSKDASIRDSELGRIIGKNWSTLEKT